MGLSNLKLSFQKQIGVVLILAAAIPTIAITQSMISLVKDFTEKQFQRIDNQCLLALGILQQEVDRKQSQMQKTARDVAMRVEEWGVDPQDSQSVANYEFQFHSFFSRELKESGGSFVLITDLDGQVVNHGIQTLQGDSSEYPLLPENPDKATLVTFKPVSPSGSIDLGELPIVQDVLESNRALSGAELVGSQFLAQMGLEDQANVGMRQQRLEGLPDRLKPVPAGFYDTEEGKVGLVLMAVEPILVDGELSGAAITGYLVNRNPELVDRVQHKTGMPTVTLFAKDLRVSTNVPYADHQTRAIGTRASSEVAQTVLEQGQYFQGQTNIIGSNYRTAYRPLYDHRYQLDRTSKPIGIAYVGQNLSEFESYFHNLQFRGYAIGGAATLLAVVAALLLARSLTKPIREIVHFADKVSMGNLEAQLPNRYNAEMGDLANAVKRLLASIKTANKMMARTYYEAGMKHFNSRDYGAAQKALQKAIALAPAEDTQQTQEIQNLLKLVMNTQEPTQARLMPSGGAADGGTHTGPPTAF
jgi:methyl-accepting chemotaxis protein PixJ